jgi:hypothetical protein
MVKAVHRIIVPTIPEVDWFTFFATILSAFVCLILGFYQRFVGIRNGSLVLIAQSVDSRNHVITALSVSAGLVAALLKFSLLDTLVGLGVALLILKSAIELGIETVHSLGEEAVNLEHYKMSGSDFYHRFRQKQFRSWMLYMIENQKVGTWDELINEASKVIDLSTNPTLRTLGLKPPKHIEGTLQDNLNELVAQGWLRDDDHLQLTDIGKNHLKQQMRDKHKLTLKFLS